MVRFMRLGRTTSVFEGPPALHDRGGEEPKDFSLSVSGSEYAVQERTADRRGQEAMPMFSRITGKRAAPEGIISRFTSLLYT